MKRPCPKVVDCVCDESGLLNLSAEDPDPLIFTGIGYTPARTYRPPTLGELSSVPVAQDCFGVAFSVASQQIADLIAEINAVACQNSGGGSGGTPVDPTPAPGTTGRSNLRGGGGGGGGGGEPRPSDLTPGSRGPVTAPLNPWCCSEDTLDPTQYIYTLAGASAGVDYLFTISSGSLPPGITLQKLSFNSAGLKGTPTLTAPVGAYPYTVTVELAGTTPGNRFIVETITDTFDLLGFTNNETAPIIPRNAAYSFLLEASGTAPLTFKLEDGDLPNGISLNETTGEISGTASNVDCGKTFNPQISFTDAEGRGCVVEVPLEVEGMIFLNAPPDGTKCGAYGPFQMATDPTGAEFSGVMQKCLEISTDGIITGTLVTPGSSFIHAEIPGNPDCYVEEAFDITYPGATPLCAVAVEDIQWIQTGGVNCAIVNANGGHVEVTVSSPGGADCDYAGCIVQLFGYLNNPCGAPYLLTYEATASINAGICLNPPDPPAPGSGNVRVDFFGSTRVNYSSGPPGGSLHFGPANPLGVGNLPTFATCTTGTAGFCWIRLQVSGQAGASLVLDITPAVPPGLCP